MFLVCSFEKSKRQKEEANTESEAMDGAQGCVLSQRPSFFGLDHGSIQTCWYLLAYILLARNGLLKDVWKTIVEKEMYMSSLEHVGFKKGRTVIKTRPGGNHNGHESNGCFIPGLCDDVALDSLARICRSDYPKLAGLNRRFRSLIDSGDLYKLRRQLGIIEQWVYLACSLMPWEAFDPVRQRWMRLPRIPCDDCFSCADKESLAVGTELLVFGQELSGFAIWMYSLVRRDWSRCPLMNLPRCLFGSSSCGEIAIIAGGSDRNGHVLKSTELYNSEMCCWESLPDMNLPRKLCSGFFMDGKFYVIGGMSSLTDPLTCGEEYDLERRTWKRIEDMYPRGNRATQSPPLVAVVNNQLYAADESTNEVKKYDKTYNTWRVVRALPVRADSYNGWGLAFKACGDKLLVVGGHRGPEGEVIVLHSWCPEDGRESDWNVLSVREGAGAFVYNCAVMGC